MRKPYTPISCSPYDGPRAAALRRIPIEITLDGRGKSHFLKDFRTEDDQEYLIGPDVDPGAEVVVRLDEVNQVLDAASRQPLGRGLYLTARSIPAPLITQKGLRCH